MVDPVVRAMGEEWVAYYKGPEIILRFARFTEHRDTLSAELTVSNELGVLHWSRLNLAAPNGRRDVIRALEEVHPLEGWRPILDRACQLVAIHLRAGEPAQELMPCPPTEGRWLVTPWVPRDEITVLYGPGGTAKSLFTLTTILSGLMGHTLGSPWAVGAIGKALYLNWESDKGAHDQRAWKLLHAIEGLPPGRFYHKRLRRPLADVITETRAEATRLGVDLIAMDSLGAACGPEPEGASAALSTLQALGTLPGSKLVVAHESKAALDLAHGTPFGSVYVWNTARSCIEIRPQESTDGTLSVTLRHAKNNDGPKAPALGLTFTFGESITLSRTTADPTAKSIAQQILDVLRTTPGMRVTALAECLGQKEESVRRALYRLTDKDRVSHVPGVNGEEAVWYCRDT